MNSSLTPDLAALVGRTLAGRYRIVRPIGAGGMGAVFEAEQLDLRRSVAAKVLVDVDAAAVARLRQEALTAGSLRSPHVVTVLDFQANPGEPPFVVMELLAGEPLSAILKRERALEPMRAARIAAQILAGLDAAHAAGVTHRDIKPSNVWISRSVTGDEHVKLLDFGIAKADASVAGVETATGAVLGTPAYLAPEQIHGLPADARTDVRAVGLVLFEMLTGGRPWSTSGPALFMEILQRPPPSLRMVAPAVPPVLADVVERACAMDPPGRFPSAAAMAQALSAVAPPSWSSPPAAGPPAAGPAGGSMPPSWASPPATVGPSTPRAPALSYAPATSLGMPTVTASVPPHGAAPRLSAPPAPSGPAPFGPVVLPPPQRSPVVAILLSIVIVLLLLVLVAGVGGLFYLHGRAAAAKAEPPDAPTAPAPARTTAPTPATSHAAPLVPAPAAPSAPPTATATTTATTTATATAKRKPDSPRCQCVHYDGLRYEALCLQPVVSCECKAAGGYQLCKQPYVYGPGNAGPDCPGGKSQFQRPDAKEGQPCQGFDQDPKNRTSPPATGKLECLFCQGHKEYPGYGGQACRGVNVSGAWLDGTWRCP